MTSRALRVVFSTDALPLTVVIPTISACTAANRMAMASSWPGSQSIKIRGRDTDSRLDTLLPSARGAASQEVTVAYGAGVGRVHVLGSLNVDHPMRVAHHPLVGETVRGQSLPITPGGKGLNQAVAAARAGTTWGITVELHGSVGDDEQGRWLTRRRSAARRRDQRGARRILGGRRGRLGSSSQTMEPTPSSSTLEQTRAQPGPSRTPPCRPATFSSPNWRCQQMPWRTSLPPPERPGRAACSTPRLWGPERT